MDERAASGEDVGDLARQAMADKVEETGNDAQARELYDVPSEDAADLARQQAEEAADLARQQASEERR